LPYVGFDFAEVKVPSSAFKGVVRDLEFDFAELAIFAYACSGGSPGSTRTRAKQRAPKLARAGIDQPLTTAG